MTASSHTGALAASPARPLVGALATRAPPPSGDGRTYVFTLRPGLRYSDGRPVRPEDFRASLERYLRVTRDKNAPYFAGILGARRCMVRRARCDLSAGIETDPRARTVTVHLTRPDAEFLHKLTNPFAYVVPSDTPVRRTGDKPPPGTGPYRVATWNAKRGGRLVRNPYFRSWAPRARPAGFADRIDISVRRNRDIQAQVAKVQRGAADVAVLANPFYSLVRADRLAELSAQSPGQVHSAPSAVTEWMFLNVRRRPFDDIDVRRALNYAADRGRIVDLVGGAELAGPTCQIVPSGFPGYEPYCPYTARQASGRGWTAPDLDRARKLVARSGRAGERVVVWAPRHRRSVGRNFAALLDDLGFRASLRVLGDDDYFPAIGRPGAAKQIGFFGWGLDYVSASTFIQPTFTCASLAERDRVNVANFCDRPLDRLVDRALTAQGAQAAAAWAAADRRVVDRAAVVPMTNHRGAVFVSKRVGNVQQHLLWFTLLDQLWVR